MTDLEIRVNQHLAKTHELQHRLAANQHRLIEANAALCHAAAGWKAGRMDAEFLAAIAG